MHRRPPDGPPPPFTTGVVKCPTGLHRIPGSETNVQILIFAREVDIETEPDADPEDDLS